MAQTFQALLLGPIISMTGDKKLRAMLVKPNQDLALMKTLIEDGKITPVIDRSFPLSQTAEAFRYYADGHSRGKVVITVEHNSQ